MRKQVAEANAWLKQAHSSQSDHARLLSSPLSSGTKTLARRHGIERGCLIAALFYCCSPGSLKSYKLSALQYLYMNIYEPLIEKQMRVDLAADHDGGRVLPNHPSQAQQLLAQKGASVNPQERGKLELRVDTHFTQDSLDSRFLVSIPCNMACKQGCHGRAGSKAGRHVMHSFEADGPPSPSEPRC